MGLRWVPVASLVLAGCLGQGGPGPSPIESLLPAIVVEPGSEAPAGTTFSFDASETLVPAGEAATYRWALGDGTEVEGIQAQHLYPPGDGTYQVILTVRTDAGRLAHASQAVVVGTGVNDVPQVTLFAPRTWLRVGETVAFRAEATDQDALTVTWLLQRPVGGGGHDDGPCLLCADLAEPNHGGDAAQAWSAPEAIGTGTDLAFNAGERGHLKLTVEARDAKTATTRASVELTVSDTVPPKELVIERSGELVAGSGGAGVSSKAYGATEPSENTYVDGAIFEVRLTYPGSGTLYLNLTPAGGGPGGAELKLLDQRGQTVASVAAEPAVGPQHVGAPAGVIAQVYRLQLEGTAGAKLNFTAGLRVTLSVGGLDPVVVSAP